MAQLVFPEQEVSQTNMVSMIFVLNNKNQIIVKQYIHSMVLSNLFHSQQPKKR